uniref:Uncharacterized protein n=1 Tax=Sparus aurata TaxID=8175 RepID=A0A671UIE6_SPAAU
ISPLRQRNCISRESHSEFGGWYTWQCYMHLSYQIPNDPSLHYFELQLLVAPYVTYLFSSTFFFLPSFKASNVDFILSVPLLYSLPAYMVFTCCSDFQ